MELALTVKQAAWFLPFVAPLCLYVAWNDLRAMKIPTWSTDLLAVIFVVVGIFLMPFPDYLWRFAHFGVVLILGMLANAIGAMGAGDSKFIASAAPFVALSDASFVMFLLGFFLLTGYALHRIMRAIKPIRNLVPDWESWHQGKRYPMGLSLGATLISYLAWPLIF